MTEAAAPISTPAEAQPSGAPASPATPQSFIGPNGEFMPGFKEAYVPEEFRSDRVYDTFSDIPGLMKLIGHEQRTLKRQGKWIPDETSSPEERAVFNAQRGVPKTPDGYKMDVQKGLEDRIDPNLVSKAREVFLKAEYTQPQVDAAWQLHQELVQDGMKQLMEDPTEMYQMILPRVMELQKADCESKLQSKWGPAYDARLQLANQVITDGIPDGPEKSMLLETLGNNPVFADFLANLGVKYKMEGKGVPSESESAVNAAMTPDQAISKAKQMMENTEYASGRMQQSSQETFRAYQKQIDELFKYAQSAQQPQVA
jgi:hypothetical protein